MGRIFNLYTAHQEAVEEGRYETLRSLGHLLVGDMELFKYHRSTTDTVSDKNPQESASNNRRSSHREYLKELNKAKDLINSIQGGRNDCAKVEEDLNDDREPLPEKLTIRYKDLYELDNGDKEKEGVITIAPFVDIRKARVAPRGQSRLEESLKELRERISRFEMEQKYRRPMINVDDFQVFLGNRYLELYDRRRGIIPDVKMPVDEPGHYGGLSQGHPQSSEVTENFENAKKSYALNARIHALARSQQKDMLITKSASAIKLPPINRIELSAEGYDSSPEMKSQRKEVSTALSDTQTTRRINHCVPLHTAIRARKRFPQHEKFRDLLHELRKLSSILQNSERRTN